MRCLLNTSKGLIVAEAITIEKETFNGKDYVYVGMPENYDEYRTDDPDLLGCYYGFKIKEAFRSGVVDLSDFMWEIISYGDDEVVSEDNDEEDYYDDVDESYEERAMRNTDEDDNP